MRDKKEERDRVSPTTCAVVFKDPLPLDSIMPPKEQIH